MTENEFLMIWGKFGILEHKNRIYVFKTFASGGMIFFSNPRLIIKNILILYVLS